MRYLLCTLLALTVGFGMSKEAFALTVSPARVEVTGDPGTTISGEIEVFNEQEGSRTFYSSFENFEPSGDSGAPHFIGAKDGLATWMSSENQITLAPGEHRKVAYSIAIPKDAEPGGQFGAIFWGSQPVGGIAKNAGGEVSIGGKIGVLVLLRVSGYVPEGGGLLEFIIKNKQRFFSTLPVSFTYKLNNTGGDRIVPIGKIKIKNTFALTSDTLSANKNEGSVLPQSTRKFEVVWGDPVEVSNNSDKKVESPGFFEMAGRQWKEFHFGWYTARLSLVFGATNQVANDSYNFFVIPWQLLILVLIVLTILGFFGKIALKKYNRFIIAQANLKQ
jgi:hypothetical protein